MTSSGSTNVTWYQAFSHFRRYFACSRCADGPSGNAAINEAKLCVAVSPGNRANSAASRQGSISNRASAESTLSGVSFLSSPIGANRKSSNSDPRAENEAERVSQPPTCVASIEQHKTCTTVSHARLGNYTLPAGRPRTVFSPDRRPTGQRSRSQPRQLFALRALA
jgi:hypothetical protein